MDVNLLIEWIVIVISLLLSALFSGLSLGLINLDPIRLQIIMGSDSEKERSAARKISPLRKHGNWLRCTLLIGNILVNSTFSILLFVKMDTALASTQTLSVIMVIAICASTLILAIFGGIIPQAIFSRYALFICAVCIWIVWPLMYILGIVSYPIAHLLDKILGDELGSVYRYSLKELEKLVDIHAEIEGSGVSGETATMLKGALGLRDAQVLNCMTSMSDVFWLRDTSKLSFDVLTDIFRSGHSRIPIFNTSDKFGRIACVGLLYVKDLILLDPDDEMPVTQIMAAFQHKTPPTVWKDDTLHCLLEIFVRESQHLAFVQDVASDSDGRHDNVYEYIGIITLEDVIEHVLQTQLIDEHDNFIDNKHMLATNRLNRIDWSMLHIFDHRERVLTTLPPQELQAVYHFLSQTIKPFMPQNRLCSEASIKNLLATSSVIRVVVERDGEKKENENEADAAGADNTNVTQLDPYKDIENNGLLLYQRDRKSKYFTLLLDGKCEIYAGRQGFRCELSRWSYLCPEALDHCIESYQYNKPLLDIVPDFTAKIIENSRVLRIKLDDFVACLQGKFDFDSTESGAASASSPRSPFRGALHIQTAQAAAALKQTQSEPHIIRHLSTPHHITDNTTPTMKNTKKQLRFETPHHLQQDPVPDTDSNDALLTNDAIYMKTNTVSIQMTSTTATSTQLKQGENHQTATALTPRLQQRKSKQKKKKKIFGYQAYHALSTNDVDDSKYNEITPKTNTTKKFKQIQNESPNQLHFYTSKSPPR